MTIFWRQKIDEEDLNSKRSDGLWWRLPQYLPQGWQDRDNRGNAEALHRTEITIPHRDLMDYWLQNIRSAPMYSLSARSISSIALIFSTNVNSVSSVKYNLCWALKMSRHHRLNNNKVFIIIKSMAGTCFSSFNKGLVNNTPQCNFSLEFLELLSQNHVCHHWLSVSETSKIMQNGILY